MTDTPQTDALRELIALLGKHKECTATGLRALLQASNQVEAMEHELAASKEQACNRSNQLADMEKELATERVLRDKLVESAQALVDQWETPSWKDVYQVALRCIGRL